MPGMKPRGPDRRSARLVLYTRSGCHLCDVMQSELRAGLGVDFPVEIVDIAGSAELTRRYGEHVPVLTDGETELCRGRYDARKVAAYLSEIR